ncbi:MAG: hypothetical protein FJW23_05995 [Acidimicrobiia bacterium]|nr:hypothetical protein [Acidimicrobiia bacterium]
MARRLLGYSLGALAILLFAWVGWPWARDLWRRPVALTDVSYTTPSAPGRTLDLYSPRNRPPGAPLVVLAAESAPASAARAVAQALVQAGAHVAVVRFRAAPPDVDVDLGLALRFLDRVAGAHGYDPGRLFLLGHGEGGRAAAALALDPERHTRSEPEIGGVITASADLGALRMRPGLAGLGRTPPSGVNGPARWPSPGVAPRPSPQGWPPFLILSGEHDPPAHTTGAHRFADALIAAGHPEVTHVIDRGRDGRDMIDWSGDEPHLVRLLTLSFVGLQPLPDEVAGQLDAERRWHTAPPVSTEAFRSRPQLVRTYQVDRELIDDLALAYRNREYDLRALPLERFQALDLLDYLASRTDVPGTGDYLVVTNLLGQQLVLGRARMEALRPLLVIGVDDERDLFRWGVSYRTLVDYTWEPEAKAPRPWLIRPLGAFLHVRGAAESAGFGATYARFAIHPGSFRWERQDPFDRLAAVDPQAADLLARNGACLECHAFRGVGPASGHVDAATGGRAGGMALALENYPDAVLQRFLFDQEAVAKQVGVSPLSVGPSEARRIHELVRRSSQPDVRVR